TPPACAGATRLPPHARGPRSQDWSATRRGARARGSGRRWSPIPYRPWIRSSVAAQASQGVPQQLGGVELLGVLGLTVGTDLLNRGERCLLGPAEAHQRGDHVGVDPGSRRGGGSGGLRAGDREAPAGCRQLPPEL